MMNDANTCMGSAAVHRIQYKLNLLSDDLFPLLRDKGTALENVNNLIINMELLIPIIFIK